MAGTVTGEDAYFYVSSAASDHMDHQYGDQTVYGVSDFSFTLDRGIVEQELVGQAGNYFKPGALSLEGSFTNCRFGASGACTPLISIIESRKITISGHVESGELSWCFRSAQVTSYEISFGDASTISEASIDFTVLEPTAITYDGAAAPMLKDH